VASCQDKVSFKEFFTKDDEETDEAHASYYSVGHKKRENGFYVDSVYSFYLPSNNKKSIRIYNEHGILNGKVLLFHENGKLKSEGIYKNGLSIGIHTNWYADETS